MKVNFDRLIESADGSKKPGDTVADFMTQVLEGFEGYEPGEKSAMWNIIGEIGRKGEIELNDKELNMLRKYWDRVNTRLDLDMTVRKILDMEE